MLKARQVVLDYSEQKAIGLECKFPWKLIKCYNISSRSSVHYISSENASVTILQLD